MKTNAAEERIEEEAPPVDQDVVQVQVPDDDDDDVQVGQATQQRDQDRRSSYKRLKEAHETEKAERARERDEAQKRFQEYDRQLAELRGSVQSARPVQQQQQPDPAAQVEQEVAYWEQQMDQAVAAIQHAAPNAPQSVLDGHRNAYKQAQRQMFAAMARAGNPQTQQTQPQVSVQVQMLQNQFPVIFNDDLLRREAELEAYKVARSKGRQMYTYADAVEANTRVMARLPGANRSPPNDNDRQKLAGTSGRAGASGGQGNTVGMSKADRRTAIAYYSGDHPLNHLSDDEKIARYAKRIKSKPDQQ